MLRLVDEHRAQRVCNGTYISLAIPKLLGGYVSPIANPLGPVFIH